MDKWIDRRRDR